MELYFWENAIERWCVKYQFTVVIEQDPESGWLIGSVAELPGCYTQAATMAELQPNIKEAVEVYLATVAEEDQLQTLPTFVGLQRVEVAV
jgi:predicted RNase H-like HicB family nuclease